MTPEADPSEPPVAEVRMTPEEEILLQLMRELNDTPAITCPIEFNWHGNEALAARASVRIRMFGLLMRKMWPSMSFEMLRGIVFHHDYELALKEAARRDRAAPVPTKEAGGLSVGMMVVTEDGVKVVMRASVAFALAGDDQVDCDWAQHFVRHELCHVDDHAFKSALIAKHPDRASYSGFEARLAPLAEALWSEFYANKYSTGSWSDRRLFFDLVRDATPVIHTEIVDAILDYRNSGDLDSLLAIVEPKVKYVAQIFGYAAGTLAALGSQLVDEAPDEYTLLQRLGLFDGWNRCFMTLQELDGLRPNWQSVLELSKLFEGCLALLAGFGLHYRPHGDGTYVDVPETPQTSVDKAWARRLGVR